MPGLKSTRRRFLAHAGTLAIAGLCPRIAKGDENVTTKHHGVRPEWLGLRLEAALEPELPIIDAHHHLWDLPGSRYLINDYLADVQTGHNVIASVYVQAGVNNRTDGPEEMRSVGETEFAAAAGARSVADGRFRACAAIVAPIDLTLGGKAAPVIDAHVAAGQGRTRGFRSIIHWHEDKAIHKVDTRPGALAEPSTHAVASLLQDRNLSLDLFVYHTQLKEAYALAHAFPRLSFILNHVGTPLGIGTYEGRRDEVLADWHASVRTLAALPNVVVKFGGMGMRFGGFGFDQRETPPSSDDLAEAFKPYFDVCMSTFGPERCMFESNFPVDKASYSYVVLWNAFKKLCADRNAEERSSLLSGTAARTYRI